MKTTGSFSEHYKMLRIEGFQGQKLLTECARAGIVLREIRTENDLSMTLKIRELDYKQFHNIVKNRYRVTVLREKGWRPFLKRMFRKKSTFIGLALVAALLFYQSAFVSEIRISGYERITEGAVRESLREAGMYEGCPKRIDLNRVKLHLYQDLDNISWVGIKYKGSMAEVTIVEGAKVTKTVQSSEPCNVVAEKAGYIEKIIAREGQVAVAEGAYVQPGDVLISGTVTVDNKVYDEGSGDTRQLQVHAQGDVYAKVIYHFQYNLEKKELLKMPTGRKRYGFHLMTEKWDWDTTRRMNPFEAADCRERGIVQWKNPFALKLSAVTLEEVTLAQRDRTQKDLEKAANLLLRKDIKEKVPEKAQLINKSLKFLPGENIIGVTVILETQEQIGKEQAFVPLAPQNEQTKEETAIGESTN